MKAVFILSLLTFAATLSGAPDQTRKANTVVLDETSVRNLRLQTVVAEPAQFERSVFALGRIEARPGYVGSVTSRISGRVASIPALPGDRITAGDPVIQVESRQPGNPPPTISLRAPLSGVITRLEVNLGDPVEPDRSLAEIADLSEVFAVARIPEHVAGQLQPGTNAHIRLAALADRTFSGTLLRFGTIADEASGTLDAVFVLKNQDGLIRPGMRAEFSVVLSTRSDVTSVPRSAVQGDASARFVYVKDFDLPNAFIKTPVVVGETNDRVVEIVSGLLPADEVVTQGAYSLMFAGTGTLSLKAALDAAHGHEHNDDGSEITGSPKRNKGETDEAGHDHDAHAPDYFWLAACGVLFVLLVGVSTKLLRTTQALAAANQRK